jgi:hypothetical protein
VLLVSAGGVERLPQFSKDEVADRILDRVVHMMAEKKRA